MREISDIVVISLDNVHHILNEYLGLLTIDVKQQFVDASESYWELFMRGKNEFFHAVCVNGWNMDSSQHSGLNQQPAEWLAKY